jgi:hypothetical protein
MSDPRNLEPELTPLYIGPGVAITGRIEMSGSPDQRVVVLGEFKGSLNWPGIVQGPPGGCLNVDLLNCRELVLGGNIKGMKPVSKVVAESILMGREANIDVDEVHVPPGGLEQTRGAVINGRLCMYPSSTEKTQGSTLPEETL